VKDVRWGLLSCTGSSKARILTQAKASLKGVWLVFVVLLELPQPRQDFQIVLMALVLLGFLAWFSSWKTLGPYPTKVRFDDTRTVLGTANK
jgi:hypothetical protein